MDRSEIADLEKQMTKDGPDVKSPYISNPHLLFKNYKHIHKKVEAISARMIQGMKCYNFSGVEPKIIRDKYQIIKEIKESTFSNVYFAKNLRNNKPVSLKRIKDDKAYFDQSLGEIYVLEYLKKNGSPQKNSFLEFQEAFYFNVS